MKVCETRKRVCISTDDVPAHESLTYWEDVLSERSLVSPATHLPTHFKPRRFPWI